MNFNFVEIGSNYFNTLAQSLPGPGLMLEPIPEYFHRIPDRHDIIKRCVALDVDNKMRTMHYWPFDVIGKDQGCLQGCGSFLENHACVSPTTPPRTSIEVPCLTWRDLFNIYSIRNINYLKLDCEGHDCILIDDLLLKTRNPPRIQTIQFETNANTCPYKVQETIALLKDLGFSLITTGHDTVVTNTQPPIL